MSNAAACSSTGYNNSNVAAFSGCSTGATVSKSDCARKFRTTYKDTARLAHSHPSSFSDGERHDSSGVIDVTDVSDVTGVNRSGVISVNDVGVTGVNRSGVNDVGVTGVNRSGVNDVGVTGVNRSGVTDVNRSGVNDAGVNRAGVSGVTGGFNRVVGVSGVSRSGVNRAGGVSDEHSKKMQAARSLGDLHRMNQGKCRKSISEEALDAAGVSAAKTHPQHGNNNNNGSNDGIRAVSHFLSKVKRQICKHALETSSDWPSLPLTVLKESGYTAQRTSSGNGAATVPRKKSSSTAIVAAQRCSTVSNGSGSSDGRQERPLSAADKRRLMKERACATSIDSDGPRPQRRPVRSCTAACEHVEARERTRKTSTLSVQDGETEVESAGCSGTTRSSTIRECEYDEQGLTWDIYGADFDPSELGEAIEKHLQKIMQLGAKIASVTQCAYEEEPSEGEDEERRDSLVVSANQNQNQNEKCEKRMRRKLCICI